MQRFLFVLAFLAGFAGTYAHHPRPDTLRTSKGPLVLQPLRHASLAVTWNGTTIALDPTSDVAAVFGGMAPPDLILVTDIHGDHLDVPALERIVTPVTTLVVPQAAADKLPATLKARAVVMSNGETAEHHGVTIRAMPMYNLPESVEAMHTKGRGNGYVLTFGDKVVYVSGDTGGIPEMRALRNIDVAFVCMNLPYTMDVSEAASAVLDFRPAIVYPYHYRGKDGLSDTAKFADLVRKGNPAIDVRLRDWYLH